MNNRKHLQQTQRWHVRSLVSSKITSKNLRKSTSPSATSQSSNVHHRNRDVTKKINHSRTNEDRAQFQRHLNNDIKIIKISKNQPHQSNLHIKLPQKPCQSFKKRFENKHKTFIQSLSCFASAPFFFVPKTSILCLIMSS